jgi:tRNA(adenine34) deaminase
MRIGKANEIEPETPPRWFLEGVHMPSKKKSRWVSNVKTDSTHPPPGLFKKRATTIARTLASNRVSPKGPGSGLRMLTYFMNRAGRGLSPERRAELQKAKVLLSSRIKRAKKAEGKKKAA